MDFILILTIMEGSMLLWELDFKSNNWSTHCVHTCCRRVLNCKHSMKPVWYEVINHPLNHHKLLFNNSQSWVVYDMVNYHVLPTLRNHGSSKPLVNFSRGMIRPFGTFGTPWAHGMVVMGPGEDVNTQHQSTLFVFSINKNDKFYQVMWVMYKLVVPFFSLGPIPILWF